jgi:hypothetical protein
MSHVDIWVVFSGAVALLFYQFVYAFQTRGIISRLKSNHHILWLQMDCPSWWVLSLSRGSGAIEAPGSNRINVTNWLNGKEYLGLNDPVLTRLARRQLAALRVAMTIGAVLMVYGMLRYFGVLAFSDAVV